MIQLAQRRGACLRAGLVCLALLACHAFLAPSVALADPEEGRVFVLVIGVRDYDDPRITDLSFPERDAQAIYDFFSSHVNSPTIKRRVRLLKSKEATRKGILDAIENHLVRKAVRLGDTAILFFSGHGFSDSRRSYLAPSDTELTSLHSTAVDLDALQKLWGDIRAQRRVLLIDACHSGGLSGLKGPGGIGRRVLKAAPSANTTTMLLASTGANQLSLEDTRSGYGVFTSSVLVGLRGAADSDRSGTVTLGELSSFLKTDVPQRALEVGGKQSPAIHITEGGDLKLINSFEFSRAVATKPSPGVPALKSEVKLEELVERLAAARGQWRDAKARGSVQARREARVQLDLCEDEAQTTFKNERRRAMTRARKAEIRRQIALLRGNRAAAAVAAREVKAGLRRSAEVARAAQAPAPAAAPTRTEVKPKPLAIKLPKGLTRGPLVKRPGQASLQVYLWRLPSGKTLEMVYVPGGAFIMGATWGRRHEYHKPAHKHNLGAYWISRHETTWSLYRSSSLPQPKAPQWGIRPNHPVVNVSWTAAQKFAAWARLKLPTEAQWEKAARGTQGQDYPWGNDDAPRVGLCNAPGGFSPQGAPKTTPVGKFPGGASPYGALDMAGNVAEWCRDSYSKNAYQRYAAGDFSPPPASGNRVFRGGGYENGRDIYSCLRKPSAPSNSAADVGFRCVLEAP
ncbi:MAG: SUMF1/EgtB/PvdO family nonheme iron enzyme [Planctomycetes bacterium]|nr:SUMF1/EgtB/PvdO family nonheme iron enzyme [Planctomycetota bacterium]